jgi:ribosomal protein S13
MEEEPEKLAEIKGISLRMAREIGAQMEDKKDLRDAMIFLQKYGIGSAHAARIWQAYGTDLYEIMKVNPYRLSEDIRGIGFATADEIARRIGIQADSEYRIRSGLLYTLTQAAGEGHSFLPEDLLVRKTCSLLRLNPEDIFIQLENLAVDRRVRILHRRKAPMESGNYPMESGNYKGRPENGFHGSNDFNDFNDLEDFNYELQEKYAKIDAEEVIVDEYQVEDADIVLVSYGISSRIARSAVDKSREKGLKVGLLRPITLSPFPTDRIKELADKGVEFISVEMSNGQLLADVQFAALRREGTYLVNRMGGNLIELKHVLAKIYEIAGLDEEIDTSKRSEEKASPNIID